MRNMSLNNSCFSLRIFFLSWTGTIGPLMWRDWGSLGPEIDPILVSRQSPYRPIILEWFVALCLIHRVPREGVKQLLPRFPPTLSVTIQTLHGKHPPCSECVCFFPIVQLLLCLVKKWISQKALYRCQISLLTAEWFWSIATFFFSSLKFIVGHSRVCFLGWILFFSILVWPSVKD